MSKTAISLISGGFDSILATRIMQRQGFEVTGLNIITPFCNCTVAAQQAADDLEIPLISLHTEEDYLELIKHPKYGYGKCCNPCLDCHLYMVRMAAEYMKQIQADCVITGEVVGQRPKSQRKHHQELVEYKSGIKGRLIRPISAKLLPETDVEREGLVDRSQLYGLQGRGRGPLIELAKELGITRIPVPSPGCCLTVHSFAVRVFDCIKRCPDALPWEYDLLNMARHFRIDEGLKLAAARDAAECDRMFEMYKQYGSERADVLYAEPTDFNGASIIAIGRTDTAARQLVADFVVRFSKAAPRPDASIDLYHLGQKQNLLGHPNEEVENRKML